MTWQISLIVDGGACFGNRKTGMLGGRVPERGKDSCGGRLAGRNSSFPVWLSSDLQSPPRATCGKYTEKIHWGLSVGLPQTASASAVHILKPLCRRRKAFCFPPSVSKVSLCTCPPPGEFNPQMHSRIPMHVQQQQPYLGVRNAGSHASPQINLKRKVHNNKIPG